MNWNDYSTHGSEAGTEADEGEPCHHGLETTRYNGEVEFDSLLY